MANKKYTVRNITKGYRGLNAVTGYVEIDPGQSREGVEITDAEYENAKRTGYFEFSTGKAAETAAAAGGTDPGALPDNHKGLDELAEREGITFASGVRNIADKQKAITDARAAKVAATGGGGTANQGGDELDAMNDDDLRATAAALSGKSVDDLKDTSREDMLKLARGQ